MKNDRQQGLAAIGIYRSSTSMEQRGYVGFKRWSTLRADAAYKSLQQLARPLAVIKSMKRRKRLKWELGDTFLVPLKDNSYGLIQVIDFNMKNVVYIAISSQKITNTNEEVTLAKEDIISLIAITIEGLDFGEFIKFSSLNRIVEKHEFKNEQYKDQGYVGSKIYDYSLTTDFLNAYHRLDYWDDWHNPNYLDEFLINQEQKPKDLLYKK